MKSALTGIRDIESWYNIPYAEKWKYLRVVVDKHPDLSVEAARTAARLKRFHDHPKYEVFYEIKPLLDWLKGLGPPADLPLHVLTRATVVALRTTTLMRSGDLWSALYIRTITSTLCVRKIRRGG